MTETLIRGAKTLGLLLTSGALFYILSTEAKSPNRNWTVLARVALVVVAIVTMIMW